MMIDGGCSVLNQCLAKKKKTTPSRTPTWGVGSAVIGVDAHAHGQLCMQERG